ncbi:hypothetical protein EHS25_000981 [Saitozyma podzolica]|uniref:Major facilitator superfamily (MFS) profile domain-containing protein n=1 Tax=Saitozyma podzolica TaxID=1890683 RepID=A0A427YGX6_9TREE|nr:hypothetical protein EHS25_000981 [Saitozyma podzolica]
MDFPANVHGDHPEMSTSSPPQSMSGPEPKALRRSLRKLDAFLLVPVTVIYFLNFLDRSNIGNAKAAGLQADLKLSNTQYSIALTVTYVPYIVAELPLTLAIKKIGPNILLPALVVAWGLVTTFQGFVNSYSGLLAARFFLGATEGAILPSSITYLSTFYCRSDLGKRVAFFFSATSLAGAFSGLLAAALLNMEGLGGKRGWQWIFIIEGLFTIVWGTLSFFILPRDPQTTRYLSEEERAALLIAHDVDRQMEEEEQPLTVSAVLSALKAPQMWLIFVQFFCSGTTLYGLAYFAPTIVGGLGYKGTQVQLYSVPPYVCSAFVALTACWTSDYFRHRGLFVVAASLISVVGYAMYLGSTNTHVLYASLFLQVIGAYTVAPLQSTWMPNNLAPFYKRVTGITLGFIATNSGGILSTWLFPTTEAPRYHRGTSILLSLASVMAFFAMLNTLYLMRENRTKAARIAALGQQEGAMASGSVKTTKAPGTFIEGGDAWEEEDGDRNVHFKYIT